MIWSQPSGPLCLWQCFLIPVGNQVIPNSGLRTSKSLRRPRSGARPFGPEECPAGLEVGEPSVEGTSPKELSRVRPKKSTTSPLPPRWTFSSSNCFPVFENKRANDFSRLLLGLVQLLVVDVHQVDAGQRWANTVFWTEYEYKYYSESEFWPNTNTNNIRFFRMSEYEYE